MSDSEFKTGDVVELKSGGPSMTVHSIETAKGSRRVRCVWFDDDHKHQKIDFVPETLQLCKDDDTRSTII